MDASLKAGNPHEAFLQPSKTPQRNTFIVPYFPDPVSYTHLDVYKRQDIHRLAPSKNRANPGSSIAFSISPLPTASRDITSILGFFVFIKHLILRNNIVFAIPAVHNCHTTVSLERTFPEVLHLIMAEKPHHGFIDRSVGKMCIRDRCNDGKSLF